MEAKVMEAETAREASAATNAKDMGTMPMIVNNEDIPSLEQAESTSSSTSREQSEWDFLEGPKKDYIEEIERQAGKEFQTHLDKLKAAPLESKASSTALAYKAENKRRKDWIIEKRVPLNESSFLLYLVDRAKGIGSSALSKISAAYQAANQGISVEEI
ncbi:hypothetical protein L3Y34_005323 [Caenorhabditis briggsae]|uniref:Uncharacterized protein n=1 Tax=Caenorhabditis briggsae TaxID=6238 RepID=A0AAE9AJ26_CAEBR|nr:hypothetical protein L3Y34_005323 [Caenorhabditis briggsae]